MFRLLLLYVIFFLPLKYLLYGHLFSNELSLVENAHCWSVVGSAVLHALLVCLTNRSGIW